jgi:hypothetical protein
MSISTCPSAYTVKGASKGRGCRAYLQAEGVMTSWYLVKLLLRVIEELTPLPTQQQAP